MARTTQQVFDNHKAAFQSGDMAQLMADYAHDAVMLLLDDTEVVHANGQATLTWPLFHTV